MFSLHTLVQRGVLLAGLFYFPNTTLPAILFSENHPTSLHCRNYYRFSQEFGRMRDMVYTEKEGDSEADTQKKAETLIPEDFTSSVQSICCPCLGFCKLLPKSPLLLKQICLGFLLIGTKITCTEILPVAFTMKSRFLDTVTKIFTIWYLPTPPSLISTHSPPTQSYLTTI